MIGRTGGFAAAALACSVTTGAQAQNVGGPPYYIAGLDRLFVDQGATLNGDPNLSGAFASDRNVAVAARSHPEYAPIGINAGSFRIYPSVDTRVRSDSNIFAREQSAKGDGISDTTAHVEIDSRWSRHMLNLFGDVRRREYFSSGTESSTTFRVGADGTLAADRRTPLAASVVYQREVEPRTSITGNFSSLRPIRYSRAQAQGQVTHEFNRVVVRSTVRYANFDYRDGQDTSGAPLPQGFRDHDELRAGGEVDYAVSPGFAPFVTATYSRFDYSSAKQVLPVDRDSDGYELTAGVDFDISRIARGRVQVGYLHHDWANPAIRPVSTPSVRARIEYFPTQILTLTALTSRNLYDSQLVDAPAYLDTSSALRADYEFRRYLIFSAEAGYQTADYRGVDRIERRTTFNAGGTYLANRRLTLRFQYIHLNQRSSGAAASVDYNDDIAHVGLSLAI